MVTASHTFTWNPTRVSTSGMSQGRSRPALSYYAGYTGQDNDGPRSPKWQFVYVFRLH